MCLYDQNYVIIFMKIRFLLFLIFGLCCGFIAPAVNPSPKIVVTEKDKLILQQKLDKFSGDNALSTGALMLKIGLDFRGTPYVAKTLDNTSEESLVVNLRELDCTTFVENCLAIALTIKSGKPDYEKYIFELEMIRYRKGQLDGYVSRLHYFSEWITDNASKGIVTDVTLRAGGIKCPLSLNFMGTHPNYYPQLKENPMLINKIKLVEKEISGKQYYYLPKETISSQENELLEGDIIALTTRIAGLDVSHLGMIYKNDGKTFLLNASSIGMKVEVTHMTLGEYLKGSKNVTGIFVIRAK